METRLAGAHRRGRASRLNSSDICRQRAAEAKLSAARAHDPSLKTAFEEIASGGLVLAGQMEIRFCFSDAATADAFQGRFGGTRGRLIG
jgi:hypothetical protein